jgi:hypothetical protein
MKIDRLFLVKNCQDCSQVRAILNPSLVEDDKFIGKKGQRLFVYSALTADAGSDLLLSFGIADRFAPLMLTAEGDVIDQPGAIMAYMLDNGMA